MSKVIASSDFREEIQTFSESWWKETGLSIEQELQEGNIANFALSVLKAFGSNVTLLPTSVTPISASDRLPTNSDCNAEGACWVSASPGRTWEFRCILYDYDFDYWLPAKTIPFPLSEDFSRDNVRFTFRDKAGKLVSASISKREAGSLLSELLEFKQQAELK